MNPPGEWVTKDPKLVPATQCHAGPYTESNSCESAPKRSINLRRMWNRKKHRERVMREGAGWGNSGWISIKTFLSARAKWLGLGRAASGLESTRDLVYRSAWSCMEGGISEDLSRTLRLMATAASFTSRFGATLRWERFCATCFFSMWGEVRRRFWNLTVVCGKIYIVNGEGAGLDAPHWGLY